MRVLLLSIALLATAGVVAASALTANGASTRPGSLGVAFSFDTSRGRPIEGVISYISVERGGARLLSAELSGGYGERAVTLPATAGRYTVRTHQRFCSGNCGNLDAPTLACTRSVRVERREHVRVRARVTFGAELTCRIRVLR